MDEDPIEEIFGGPRPGIPRIGPPHDFYASADVDFEDVNAEAAAADINHFEGIDWPAYFEPYNPNRGVRRPREPDSIDIIRPGIARRRHIPGLKLDKRRPGDPIDETVRRVRARVDGKGVKRPRNDFVFSGPLKRQRTDTRGHVRPRNDFFQFGGPIKKARTDHPLARMAAGDL